MFTVIVKTFHQDQSPEEKFFSADNIFVGDPSIEKVEKTKNSDRGMVHKTLFLVTVAKGEDRGKQVEISLYPNENAYVMNDNGKTVAAYKSPPNGSVPSFEWQKTASAIKTHKAMKAMAG